MTSPEEQKKFVKIFHDEVLNLLDTEFPESSQTEPTEEYTSESVNVSRIIISGRDSFGCPRTGMLLSTCKAKVARNMLRRGEFKQARTTALTALVIKQQELAAEKFFGFKLPTIGGPINPNEITFSDNYERQTTYTKILKDAANETIVVAETYFKGIKLVLK